jgi:hypothetical protein
LSSSSRESGRIAISQVYLRAASRDPRDASRTPLR